jgi:hypothetical protein
VHRFFDWRGRHIALASVPAINPCRSGKRPGFGGADRADQARLRKPLKEIKTFNEDPAAVEQSADEIKAKYTQSFKVWGVSSVELSFFCHGGLISPQGARIAMASTRDVRHGS